MIVVEKNEGPKIPYAVKTSKITFDDEIMLNLDKYERDCDVHIDICFDMYGSLVIGAVTGSAYVAEIDIPARRYTDPVYDDEGEEVTPPQPIPLDMNKVTLTLWAID